MTAGTKLRRIDSYNRTARRPLVGTLWMWEPESAPALIRVTSVVWNGEEWRVGTLPLPAPPGPERELWNDLSRFWEACHYVRPQAGPPGVRGATRSGTPEPDELRPGE